VARGDRRCGHECSRQSPTVRDRLTAPREPRVRTDLGRACALHYWRHPGRGSRLRLPSSRFHGFDPHAPDRSVGASRAGIYSLTLSPSDRCGPPVRGRRTDGVRKRPHTTDMHRTAHRPALRATAPGHQKPRPYFDASPMTANQPSQLLMYVLTILPRPRRLSVFGQRKSTCKLGVIPA